MKPNNKIIKVQLEIKDKTDCIVMFYKYILFYSIVIYISSINSDGSNYYTIVTIRVIVVVTIINSIRLLLLLIFSIMIIC